MVLESVANTILDFVNYGQTVLWILFVIEVFKFIGVKNVNAAGRGIAATRPAKYVGKQLNKLFKEEEKAKTLSLNEYIRLETLKKDVEDSNKDEELKRKVGSDSKKAKRTERKANRRIVKLEDDVKDFNFPNATDKAKANKMVDEMEIFNKQVIEKIKEFDTELEARRGFVNRKRNLLNILADAILAEKQLQAEFKKLEALTKGIFIESEAAESRNTRRRRASEQVEQE